MDTAKLCESQNVEPVLIQHLVPGHEAVNLLASP